MRRTVFTLLICLILTGTFTAAQNVPVMKVTSLPSHTAVPAGGEFQITTELIIPAKTHLTENFLEIYLEENSKFSTGLIQVSSGTYEKEEVVRRGTAYLKIPVYIPDEMTPGKYIVKGASSYQICTEGETSMCFPPKDAGFQYEIEVLASGGTPVVHTAGHALSGKLAGVEPTGKTAGASAEVSESDGSLSLEQRLQNALSQNWYLAFFLVFIGGFLTSLTPCVYPMIPITIGYIGGKSAGGGKSRGFILSLFYVLGLALIYSVFGVLAALTGSLFGSITQTPAVLAVVAGVFLLMGLSMLGLFDIALPTGLTGRMQSGGPKKGFIGAVLMGMVAGLVAAPCAGPVIIVLLVYIATTGNVVFGFSLMMTFALGMGILFIALGTFSGLLTSLPSAGMWMDKIKKSFGIILLAAAIWMIKPLLPPPAFGLILGFGLLLLGAAVGAFKRITEDSELKDHLFKGVGLLLAVSGIYMVVSLIPIPGRVIPELGSTGVQETVLKEDIWRTDLPAGLKEAAADKKLVVLDFGAEWCAACKELEHDTFPDPAVQARLKTMVPIKVDCTKSRDPKIRELQKEYDVKGLPTVIVLDHEGLELSRFTSFLPPADFLKFLDQVTESAVD